jgi:hypothetical protein
MLVHLRLTLVVVRQLTPTSVIHKLTNEELIMSNFELILLIEVGIIAVGTMLGWRR